VLEAHELKATNAENACHSSHLVQPMGGGQRQKTRCSSASGAGAAPRGKRAGPPTASNACSTAEQLVSVRAQPGSDRSGIALRAAPIPHGRPGRCRCSQILGAELGDQPIPLGRALEVDHSVAGEDRIEQPTWSATAWAMP
jgi:hypothetical protein